MARNKQSWTKIGIALALCGAMAYAADEATSTSSDSENQNRIVLGIYGGGSMFEMSSSYYTTTFPYDDLPGDYDKMIGGLSYGGKIGYDMYFLERHGGRFYLDYMHTYANSKERTLGRFNMHTIGLNADYRFVIAGGLSAFAGAGLAYNIITTQYLGNMNAIGGSFNVGLGYAIGFLELELRFRYLVYDIPEKSSTYLPTILGQKTQLHLVELNSPASLHFGVNFRF